MTEELKALEARKESLRTELETGTAAPEPVRLHPGLAQVYEEKLSNLGASLRAPGTRAEAISALRSLIEEIIVSPSADGKNTEVRLTGDLATLLGFASSSGCSTKMVAGAGFEPATFRL